MPTDVERALPRSVYAITVLWALLTLCWSFVLPIYRSADEFQHVSAIHYWEHRQEWPGYKQMRLYQRAIDSEKLIGVPQDGIRYLTPEGATPRGQRPSFDQIGDLSLSKRVNTIGQHPPGYYVLLGTVARMLPADIPFDLEVWLYRLISVLMLIPLPLLAAAMARRLGADRPVIIASALAPLAVPQIAVFGGSVNNDNLLLIAATALAYGTVCIVTGELRYRVAVALGIVAAIALLAKAWALLIVPFVVIAYLIIGYRTGQWRRVITAAAVFGTVSMLGMWWWIRNLIRFGAVQPAGHGANLPDGPLSFSAAIGRYLEQAHLVGPTRFWSMLSIKGDDQPVPYWFVDLLTGLLILGLIYALLRRRSFQAQRTDMLLMVLPFLLLLAALLVSTWSLTTETGVPRGLQGRYLYAGLVALLVAIMLAVGARLSDRARRWLPAVLGGFAVVYLVACLYIAMTYHWGYRSPAILPAFSAMLAWAPVPAGLVVCSFTAFAGALGWVTWCLVKDYRVQESLPSVTQQLP